jgi:NAD(P)-dependent dehydrogenase (short-subunit alcohol dehydrogenase family)
VTETFSTTALLDKSIVVTGASSGIGRAAAQLFASCGARICLVARSRERLLATLGSLSGSGHTSHEADIGAIDETATLLQAIGQRDGGISGIFHSAGVGLVRPSKLIKREQFDSVLGASLGGAFAIARAASMKGVMADGGSIALMSSVAAYRGQIGMALYAASKGAIDAATRSLACEFAPRRIRVNSIVSGAVKTEMHERTSAAMPTEALAAYESKHLLGFGNPSDVAAVALFLLSDASRWVTGAAWIVDGGYLAK